MIGNLIKTAAVSGICLAASASASLATSDWDEMQPAEYERYLVEEGFYTAEAIKRYKALVEKKQWLPPRGAPGVTQHYCDYFVSAEHNITNFKVVCSDKHKRLIHTFEFRPVMYQVEQEERNPWQVKK